MKFSQYFQSMKLTSVRFKYEKMKKKRKKKEKKKELGVPMLILELLGVFGVQASLQKKKLH